MLIWFLLYSFSPLHKETGSTINLPSPVLSSSLFIIISTIMAAPKNMGFLVCLLIMALDVTAGILGIEAEIAENKVKHVRMLIFECRESSHKAFNLGLAAVVLLTLAHAIANVLGGCVCIWSKAEMNSASPNKQLAVASLIFSWITLAAAFSMLIIGTLSNTKRTSCGLTHHRLFSIGGIVCFIHGLFTVAFYVSAAASAREAKLPGSAGHT